MKQKIVRASAEDIEEYLKVMRKFKPKNAYQRAIRERQLKFIPMSDDELYHYFMDNPIEDCGSFQVIYDESGDAPRLFRKGKKLISMGVPLRKLKNMNKHENRK